MITNPNDGNTPRVEIALPEITVSSAGLITATSEQTAGYVPGGTKSSTKQLPTQAAKTVTPRHHEPDSRSVRALHHGRCAGGGRCRP